MFSKCKGNNFPLILFFAQLSQRFLQGEFVATIIFAEQVLQLSKFTWCLRNSHVEIRAQTHSDSNTRLSVLKSLKFTSVLALNSNKLQCSAEYKVNASRSRHIQLTCNVRLYTTNKLHCPRGSHNRFSGFEQRIRFEPNVKLMLYYCHFDTHKS